MHFVNIKHLSLKCPIFLLLWKAGSLPSCLCPGCIKKKKHVMDCYLTSSQPNNSSQSKKMWTQEPKVCSRANGFIRKWTQPFLQRPLLPEGANLSSPSHCFESSAETSQAEWVNIAHCCSILSKLPQSKDWSLFFSWTVSLQEETNIVETSGRGPLEQLTAFTVTSIDRHLSL